VSGIEIDREGFLKHTFNNAINFLTRFSIGIRLKTGWGRVLSRKEFPERGSVIPTLPGQRRCPLDS
jgi:hypothetical protein